MSENLTASWVIGLLRRRLQWFLIALVAVQFFQTRGAYGMLFRTDAIAMGALVGVWTRNGNRERTLANIDIRLIRGALLLLLATLCYIGDLRQHQLNKRITNRERVKP